MHTLLPAVTKLFVEADFPVVAVVCLAEPELHAETAIAKRTSRGRGRTAARVQPPRLSAR
jgi:hypothetical protein